MPSMALFSSFLPERNFRSLGAGRLAGGAGTPSGLNAWFAVGLLAGLLCGCGGTSGKDGRDAGSDSGPDNRPPVLFRLPIDNTDGRLLSDFVIGVDHDPTDYGSQTYRCLSYAGELSFPYCYDQHEGNDFLLDDGFDMMDEEIAWVVAAADGTVIDTQDGNYDRCHSDLNVPGGINCDGYEMRANYVILEHVEGVRTLYWHLKRDTVAVTTGQRVRCGEGLGLVGSSGRSAMPHLHFEVHGSQGEVIDPYAGPMSQPESWWVQQDGPNGFPGETCEGEASTR